MSLQAAQNWYQSNNDLIPALDLHHQIALQCLKSKARTRGDLAEIIARDPGMSISLYRRVNGQLKKGQKTGVDTIRSALGLLGDGVIEDLIVQHPVLSKSHPNLAQQQCYQQLVSRCYHTQAQLDRFTGMQRVQAIDEVRGAALLYHVAEFYLCLLDHSNYQRYLDLNLIKGRSHGNAERVFGFDLIELGGFLAEQLHLPELVVDALSITSHSGLKLRLIQLAVKVSDQAEIGWYSSEMDAIAQECAEYLNKPVQSFYQQLHQAALVSARDCPLKDVFSAAAGLILLPESTAKAQISAVATAKTGKPDQDFALKLKKLLQAASATRSQVMDSLMTHLNLQVGLAPVLFLTLSPDRAQLSAHSGKGIEPESVLRKLVIDFDKSGLLKSLASKPQALWIDAAKYEKYQSLLPADLKNGFITQEFFLMSLYVDNRPGGIVIANRGSQGSKLDKAAYLEFRAAIQSTAKALTWLSQHRQASAA